MITIIGKLDDVAKYELHSFNPAFNVNYASGDWTPESNAEWLEEAWNRGDDFMIVSRDVSGHFAVELRWLIEKLLED